MIRRPPRSTRVRSSAASDVYKRQPPARCLPVDEHDRDVEIVGKVLDRRPRRSEDDPVDLTGQAPQRVTLQPRLLIGVGNEDRLPGLTSTALYALDDVGEERVGEVRDDQADVAGAAGDQASRRRVRAVAETTSLGQHTTS